MVGNKNSRNPSVLADTRGKSTGPRTVVGKSPSVFNSSKFSQLLDVCVVRKEK